MKVFLPIQTVSEMNRRDHWAVRHRRLKSHRQAAYLATKAVELPCVVTLTRIGPRRLDTDNLAGALKGARDGIADRLGVDDADPRVEWRYEQEVRRDQRGVLVEIETIGATA